MLNFGDVVDARRNGEHEYLPSGGLCCVCMPMALAIGMVDTMRL